MNVEAQKLNIIERFMKIREESAIQEMEEAITRIEMKKRADDSVEDVKKGKVRAFEEFNSDVKEWMKNRKSIR